MDYGMRWLVQSALRHCRNRPTPDLRDPGRPLTGRFVQSERRSHHLGAIAMYTKEGYMRLLGWLDKERTQSYVGGNHRPGDA